MDLWNIKNVKNLMSEYGCSLSKSLGQNFLINRNICSKIAELGSDGTNGVIEIGPGIGALTVEIAKKVDKLVSIEIDAKLINILKKTLSEYSNVKIINADVLKVDLRKLIKQEFEGKRVSICANLPYYITSPIIMHILESKLPIDSITVMVQKEAAQRICAKPGTRDAGAISLAVRYYSEPSILFDVSRGNFVPPPEVDSSVIRLDIRKEPLDNVISEEMFFQVVKAAFSQRRKTILNSITNGLKIAKEDGIRVMQNASIDIMSRAENLTLEQFIDMSNKIFEMKKEITE